MKRQCISVELEIVLLFLSYRILFVTLIYQTIMLRVQKEVFIFYDLTFSRERLAKAASIRHVVVNECRHYDLASK